MYEYLDIIINYQVQNATLTKSIQIKLIIQLNRSTVPKRKSEQSSNM